MAPYHPHRLLVWTLPTIAILFSYLWFKKKRIGGRSDSGDTSSSSSISKNGRVSELTQTLNSPPKSIQTELKEAEEKTLEKPSPNRTFSRSLSGVDSAPIDIVLPRKLRSAKSNPIVISDEDLDLEIEKIKSMKNNGIVARSKPDNSPVTTKSKTPSPTTSNSFKAVSPVSTPKKIVVVESNTTGRDTIDMVQNDIVQNDIVAVEEKLTTLKLDSSQESPKKCNSDSMGCRRKENKELQSRQSRECDSMGCRKKENEELRQSSERDSMGCRKKENEELQRQSSERDSANHSPVDVMLPSPSLSSISDNQSEGSSDSGKGLSDVATPPPSRTPGIDATTIVAQLDVPLIYEFTIPQLLVGKLIGRHGSFVTQIKNKTSAHVIVRKHPTDNTVEICSVNGTEAQIEKALKMIRDKFPSRKYPDVTLEQVDFFSEMPSTLISDNLYHPAWRMFSCNLGVIFSQLKLVEGVNNDSIVCCMVAPNHLFLQQPTHPSFPSLNMLTGCMNSWYQQTDSPLLPFPLKPKQATFCVAYSVDSWHRAMVMSTDPKSEMTFVQFLDYGGYAVLENSQLRKIHTDFMLLPFQAAECMLANIKSVNADGSWPEEAYTLVADITRGSIMSTQVVEYTRDHIPLVLCYVFLGSGQVIFLNEHLVSHGFAEWLFIEQPTQESAEEGAVGGVVA